MAGPASHREIAMLSLPALGTLAAEPLYLLADTAIVGHLGTRELAALALAAVVLGAIVNLCNFLAYGATGRIGRLVGAGDRRAAAFEGIQGLWLAAAVGAVVVLACLLLAGGAMDLLAGDERADVRDAAARYLRIGSLGLPFALIALAAQGYLRGVADLRTPLVIVVWANVVNVALELLFVYGFGWGLDGSAAGTVVAQAGMATAFVVVTVRRVRGDDPDVPSAPAPRAMAGQLTIGAPIVIRTGSLLAAFLVATAVLARFGAPSLGAHQIAFQIFIFLALVLDAIAIAAQVLVSRALGAGQAGAARDTALRICRWGLVAGTGGALLLLAGRGVLPRAFTSDPEVLRLCSELWPVFALMLPVGAVVFALDGILLGAGDLRYIAIAMVISALGVFLPIALLTLRNDWGVRGVWWGIVGLMLARFLTLAPRLAPRRWARFA
ncbi:MAG: MATE family efflux transporter [Baekduia sp.]